MSACRAALGWAEHQIHDGVQIRMCVSSVTRRSMLCWPTGQAFLTKRFWPASVSRNGRLENNCWPHSGGNWDSAT